MKISVVCPFFNEELIIEQSIRLMYANLQTLKVDWELIVVNDGSRDASARIAEGLASELPRLRCSGYEYNRGRGFALKTGIAVAQGEYIFTMEIDSSWGDDIVARMLGKFEAEPWLDVVIASPHLSEGGYRNVPRHRVALSHYGNRFISLLFLSPVTMHTGMTRGYRAEVIKHLSTSEKGKEFHLEVLLKLHAEGFLIGEVPAVLEWKHHKVAKINAPRRMSSFRLGKLVFSHLGFAFLATPLKYLFTLSLFFLFTSGLFMLMAIVHLLTGRVSVYFAIIAFSLLGLGIVMFGFGVVSAQNSRILLEMWRIDRKLNQNGRNILPKV